jgi:filamentous hemagglutinin family protein
MNAGVTNITTGTIRNGTGFNSFSQFQVGTGNTVNLHVPDAANKLLNIVRDGPVFVDGILNGYKSGQIGGDIYFADPHGFVVGPNGTVNVGSLTVQTPKAAFLESVIDAQGNIDDAATAALLAGATPISADGFILVQGKINAQSGVRLFGQTVSIGGTTPPTTPAEISKMLFDATVNTAGLKEGAAITVRNGAIVIEAAGDAVLGGTIQASGAADHDAGSVTVTAGNDVTISGDARLAAAGGGDGSNAGSVLIKAGHDLGVEQGAVANVHGKDGGNGGTVELSAAGTGSFTGATLDAGSDRGAAGSILIDPSSVVIGGGAPTNYPSDTPTIPSTIPSIASNGANVTVTADTSIVIASNGYINTRKTAGTGNDKTSLSTGNSGDVTLNAPGIQVFGEINSFALNTTGAGASTWTDGKITLNASLSEHGQAGHTFANTGIDIYGVLNGGVIDLEANATARTEYDTVAAVFVDLAESLFGVGAGYVKSTTNAAINIYSGAHVTGSGDVTLNAWTNTVAKDPVYNVSLLTFMSLTGGLAVPSVVVGDVNATTTAHIGSGATVSSGGALTVRAHSSDDLEVSTFTVTTSVPIDASVAYSTADIQSNALIDSGATITANSLRVAARNDNSFNTSVSVYDLGDGNAGIAVAIADGHHAQATANLGASPTLNGTFAANAGPQVLVEAENSTTADAVLATATVGTTKLLRPIVNAVQGAVQALQNRIGGKVSDASGSDKTKTPKFGASVAVSLDNRQGSSASIAGSDSAHAPTITATGPVAVVAHTFDTGVRSEGASGINAPDSKQGTAQDPSSTIAVSAGVAYAERTLTADAEIGTAVHITAPEIGVLATTDLPIDVTWLDWDSFNAVLAHANGFARPWQDGPHQLR